MSDPQDPATTEADLLVVRPGKWTLVVIAQLREGTMRFNELRRNMGGVPQKSLSVTLRELERDGFVTRKAYATIPPRVEYDLTDLGRELLHLADDFKRFALRNRVAVERARRLFDAADGRASL
ncbi:DNA-binding HxlR family transcriptional regulator [Devosia subaequoris]|uniref:DNA-binding HxlR family transcriptional regulator n=1 Tax=Devosia subaequoris TaxID=395930 RepID=A0A7W6IMD4_9HYPH|nr:helix-turn-helix domain-containing protein [Devosia subaequoris]MBB4052277.1 DNA-binding HxlR family transcriptional regulator [Devosia subaequoris]MCP1209440.1 helix-turn-helix transcriptional regulator [Devosia subaequoris]